MINRSKLVFFLLGKKYGFNFNKYYDFVSKSQYWSKEQIENYQNEKLQKIIRHAYENVKFYKNQFDELGLKPKDIKSKDDLKKLPVIDKKVVADNFEDFLSNDFDKRKKLRRHTGGTTGLAFEFYNDIDSWALNWATKVRAYEWAGFSLGKDKLGVLAGGSLLPQDSMSLKDRLWRKMNNFYSMPITRMNDSIMKGYLKEIKKQEIKFLRGYPTAIYTLAKFAVDSGFQYELKAVFTTAEMLYEHHREMVKKAFNCEVYNEYGCGEGMAKAYECDMHNGLHLSICTSIVEILDNEKIEVEKDVEGEVVITSLNDYAMPFIRYAPGDRAIKGDDHCECGRQLPKIKKIIGRSSDIIRFSNGNVLNGLSIPFEAWTETIKQFQIIEIDQDAIEVLFIPTKYFRNEHEEQAYKIMKYQCGPNVRINIKKVEFIPVPSSGKFRYVISKKNK